jgi:hypothetical protein
MSYKAKKAKNDEFVLLRWRRHGKDWLYVARADGSKVGYWDLLADQAHPESPDQAELLHAAVTSFAWSARDVCVSDGDAVEAAIWRP